MVSETAFGEVHSAEVLEMSRGQMQIPVAVPGAAFGLQHAADGIVEVVEIALPASRIKHQMLWDNLRSLSFCLMKQGFGQLRIRVGNLSDLLEVNTVFHCYPLASKVVLGQALIR